jgi:hypothetical protein
VLASVPAPALTRPRLSIRAFLTLLALLAVAAAVRLWGLLYGLPWLFYQHDETQVVLRGLRFGTGDLNPHYFAWPGILMFYVSFACDVMLFLMGRIAGLWSGKQGFAAAYFSDPKWFYLLPRLVTVAPGRTSRIP